MDQEFTTLVIFLKILISKKNSNEKKRVFFYVGSFQPNIPCFGGNLNTMFFYNNNFFIELLNNEKKK